jgi:prepilin-type N-terminal cleavage/methylation domain-containing protein
MTRLFFSQLSDPEPCDFSGCLKRNLVRYRKNNSGFTLIEVLIASIILFSAISITAELYTSSSLSAEKASSKAKFYQLSPMAVSAIKADIRQLSENRKLTEFSGDFTISGISYNWQAQRTIFKSRAADVSDFEPSPPQFGIFEVNVFAQENTYTPSNSKNPFAFTFKVATW